MGLPKLRYLLALAVVAAESLIHLAHWPVAVAVAGIVLLRYRWVTVAFVAALALGSLAPMGTYLLLLWLAFQAGREVVSRSGTIIVACAAAGTLAGQLVRTGDPRFIAAFLIVVALPFLVGRYLAQHERLVTTLRANERLRLARDMHDSLGHRLSLVAVQAAALEVSDLPPAQRDAVSHLARSTREAMDELYGLVGGLRGDALPVKGLDDVKQLVTRSRASGLAVTFEITGVERPLPPEAYRVVEEGLTNAAKHGTGAAMRVGLTWERDALLVSVASPAAQVHYREGNGLRGLRERVEHAGGLLDHRTDGEEFRLSAMFPAATPSNRTAVVIGLSIAALMFILLPATVVVGVAAP